MRKTLLLFFALCTCLWGFALDARATKEPPAQFGQWVVDNAGLFSRAERTEFSNALQAVQSRTGGAQAGAQIAVLTVKSLDGDDIKEFAIRTFRAWKLGVKGAGSQGKSNGILIVIVKDSRAVRIEVGTGLEGRITDALSSQIIRARFTNGVSKSAVEALRGTIQDIATEVYKEYSVNASTPLPQVESKQALGNGDGKFIAFGLAIFFAGILGAIFHRRRRLLRYWFGGTLGALSWGGIALVYAISGIVLGAIMAFGYVLGYFLSALFRQGGDGWLFDPFPRVYPVGGGQGGGLRGGGGDSAGGGSDGVADSGLFDGLGNAVTNVPVGDCPGPGLGGCDPGGCEVGGC